MSFSHDPMIIRSGAGFGSQLHIHTDDEGNSIRAAHIKTNAGEHIRLSNYEAAMADLYADRLGLKSK